MAPDSCFCWMLSPAPVHSLPAPVQAPPLAALSIFSLHVAIPWAYLFPTFPGRLPLFQYLEYAQMMYISKDTSF